MQGRSPLLLNLEAVKKYKEKPEEAMLTESPTISAAKRRHSKVIKTRKTNEQLIQESHEELMQYVNSVDTRVQDIIQAHEAEFLGAYQQHMKKVREQMLEIQKRSLNNASSEKAHLDKIEALEKQLIIFREESLKMFEKVVHREKQIEQLTMRLKEIQSGEKESQKKLHSMTKRNRELQVMLMQLQNKLSELQKSDPQQRIVNFNSTPKPKASPLKDDRPNTTANRLKSNSLSLRMQSTQKEETQEEIHWLRQKLEEKVGRATIVNIDTVMKILSEKEGESKHSLADYRKGRSNLYSNSKRKYSFRIIDHDQSRSRSKLFADRRQLQQIFSKCVEQVRRDIIRRSNIPSLNYFKQNGPRNIVQFKKLDYFTILQLLVKDEKMLQSIHSLIFLQ